MLRCHMCGLEVPNHLAVIRRENVMDGHGSREVVWCQDCARRGNVPGIDERSERGDE